MNRRKFLRSSVATGAATVAAPHVASAQAKTFSWKMTNAYGPGAPFYVQGPGSPTDFIKMVDAMSQGRLKIQHFAAGELIPALEGLPWRAGLTSTCCAKPRWRRRALPPA